MTAPLHLHGWLPCFIRSCAPQDQHVWTAQELRDAGLPDRLGTEAQGICPDSGETFVSCLGGPCDCFLTGGQITGYVAGCRTELIRQAKVNHESR